MKRFFSLLAISLALMTFSGCVNTEQFTNDIADLQRRVTALEDLCKQMNKDIESVQGIASAAQSGNYITSVTPISYGGETIGYTISFVKGDPITIYNGKNGTDGRNGTDGLNGTDGHTPQIGVRQDTDGVWYWTVDSNWLLDTNGSKVKAVGQDGKDGKDGEDGEDGKDGNDGLSGQDGQDGITPQLKIEDDYWYVSTDKGATWTKLSKAKGEDGQEGTGGDSMFTHIDYSTSDDYVIFTLSNGVNIKVPTWPAFDRLNSLCNEMNSNLEGIGTILEAIDQSLFIKSVSTIVEGNKEIGYIITFSNEEKINIYHGKDGNDGSGGGSGHTPQMGVRQHTDGIWYWTVDGEWLLDSNGSKVKAVGTDGQDGENGQDGITPQLKIENGYWYVSMDEGSTWTKHGKATGEGGNDGDTFFKSVTQDENNVIFTLTDDTVLTLPKASILEITFDHDGDIALTKGVKEDIGYIVTSSQKPVKVEVVTSSDINAKVTPADADGLTGTITFEASTTVNEYSRILVMVSNGSRVIMSKLKPLAGSYGYENGYKWVDLGLPSGLKWATCNVGANAPEEYGDYYAWGETEPYYSSQDPLTWKDGKSAGYKMASYQWCKWGVDNKLTKYNTKSYCGQVVDNKTILELADDAARVNWGGSWRMPTDDDWTELRTECTWAWATQNGINGRLVTGPNGASIFLPAAGCWVNTDLLNADSYGYYRSSSLFTYPSYSWSVDFSYDGVVRFGYHRSDGLSVRPVTDFDVRVSVSNISLDQSSVKLKEGESATLVATVLPSNATQPNVIWSSSDNEVATVTFEGVVTAIAAGSATITATSYDGGFTASCAVTVNGGLIVPTTGAINGHEWVDLGLPSGLKWAACNVGATAPEEYGDYFAWGETEPKLYYDLSTYKFRTSGDSWDNVVLSKYNTSSSFGPVDDKYTLELEDDAARANWGGTWRMPTDSDWTELIEKCIWTWVTFKGVAGWSVTSSVNGKSIFLPAAGYKIGDRIEEDGYQYCYWSSSLSTEGDYIACCAWCIFGYRNVLNLEDKSSGRFDGFSVRGVTE